MRFRSFVILAVVVLMGEQPFNDINVGRASQETCAPERGSDFGRMGHVPEARRHRR